MKPEEITNLGLKRGDRLRVKIINQDPCTSLKVKPGAHGSTVEGVFRGLAPSSPTDPHRILVELTHDSGVIYGLHDWLIESITTQEVEMTKMHVATNKGLVRGYLEHAEHYDWTLQGLGMLRTYLDPDHTLRLHVWTEAGANEGVSELHTHPWDFMSEVIAGEVVNTRYVKLSPQDNGVEWQEQTIKCGEGGGLVGEPQIVKLGETPPETYAAGACYQQTASEIHRSNPADGTVTIISRTFGEDTEHAYVYFPVGAEWVTAEPRPATFDEVKTICDNALEKWF